MNEAPNLPIGCKAINDHISRPVPEVLWHYTTYAGFQGIVDKNIIWATEYRFLNDQQEFKHGKLLAQNLCEDEPEFTPHGFPARNEMRNAVESAFSTPPLHEEHLRIMVASFSEIGDLLSQWRGYSGNSTGVSIGLDLRGLRPPVQIGPTAIFAKCVYEKDQKAELLRSTFSHFRSQLEKCREEILYGEPQDDIEGSKATPGPGEQVDAPSSREPNAILHRAKKELVLDLVRIAPLLKSEHFAEEQEWRLVLPSEMISFPTNKTIEFRPIRDGLVPYIAFPLLQPNQTGEILLKDVILGPGSHPSAAIGVNMFLQSKFIPISAQPSKIPYRPT